VTNEAGYVVTKTNCVNSSAVVFNLWKYAKFQTMVLSVLTLFSILGGFFLFNFGGECCLLCQGYFQLEDHHLSNVCCEDLWNYIWILLLPTDIRYMYIWNSKSYTFAIRHKTDTVNRKTLKAACVSVTAQYKDFIFVSKFLSSAVKKYCGLICFTFFVCKVGRETGCGLMLFQVQW
jgi:hypothetical protein